MLQIFLGRKEDVLAILKALGIKEGESLKSNSSFSRDIIEVYDDNTDKKNQGDWIRHFNGKCDVMASVPDFYYAIQIGNNPLLGSLQKVLQNAWEITSTRIFYQLDSLNAKIVHYFGSQVIQPIETEIIIPFFPASLLEIVLDDADGLAFMQALLGTQDKKDAIIRVLALLSGKDKGHLKVWTPDQEGREEYPERPTLLVDGEGSFRIQSDDTSFFGLASVVSKD